MHPDKLIAAAAGMLCGTSDQVRVREAVGSVADWDGLVSYAQVENLSPGLYWALQGSGSLTAVPEDARRELEGDYWNSLARSVVLEKELSGILGAMESSSVCPVVLKGAALAGTVYEDPALRPMSDIDLMVREEEFVQACGSLSSHEGYGARLDMNATYMRLTHAVFFGGPPGMVTVEIHKSLLGDIALRNERSVWDRVLRDRNGRLVLCPEDMLAHICVHAALRHQLRSPSQLLDIAMLVRHEGDLDWRRFTSVCKSLGAARPIGEALVAVRELLGAEIPPDVVSELISVRDGFLRRAGLSLVQYGGKRHALRMMGRMLLQDGWRRRLEYARWNLFPSADWVNRSVGVRRTLVYPYYVYRVIRAGVVLAAHLGRRFASRFGLCTRG